MSRALVDLFTLDNGLKVIVERRLNFKALSVGLWVKVGSEKDPDSWSGLSHALEHLVFKGSFDRTAFQIAKSIEKKGGELNAFTEKELTCFHTSVLSEDVGLALESLRDIVFLPKLAEEDWEKEKRVLAHEIALSEETPEDFLTDLFFEALWKNHPLGRSIQGDVTSLRSIEISNLKQHHLDWYLPNNCILSIAGDVSFERAKKLVQKIFGGLKRGKVKRVKTKGAPRFCRFEKFKKFPTSQVYYLCGYQAPAFFGRGKLSTVILNQYFSAGMSSTLFQEMREKQGLTYQLDADYISYSNAGVFCFTFSCPRANWSKCNQVLDEEISKVVESGIPKVQLDFLKEQLTSVLHLSQDSTDYIQETNARNLIWYGRYFPIESTIKKIKPLSSEAVTRNIREILKNGKRASLIVSERKPGR